MKRRLWITALGAVIVLQMAILGGLWVYSQYPRWVGQEIRLAVRPVDPRAPFRGHYVRLDYAIGTLPIPTSGVPRVGRTLYVTLERRGALWHAEETGFVPPESGLYLTGRIRAIAFDDIRVRYGIEAWFTDPQQARTLSRSLRQGGVARVKVAPDGRAALLGVMPAPAD